MKKKIGVIVVGNHVTSLGIIRGTGRMGVPVFLLNETPFCISRFSKYVKKFVKIPPKEKEKKLINFLINLTFEEAIKDWILIPSNDEYMKILSQNKKILEKYYRVAIAPWNVIKFAYDKKLTIKKSKKLGIPIPKTLYPKNKKSLKKIPTGMKYPLVVKPTLGHEYYNVTGIKMRIAQSKEELVEYYREVSDIIGSKNVTIQEFIPGRADNLYNVGLYMKNDRVLASFTGKKIRQRPHEFGTGVSAESVNEPLLVEHGKKLLNSINFEGLAYIEFKRDPRDGKFKIMEINSRFWNFHNMSWSCGVDFTKILYHAILGDDIFSSQKKRRVKWIHIFTDTTTALKEILSGRWTFEEYLKSIKGKKEYAVFSSDDPLPFIMELILLPYLWLTR